jgi:hypothetical protein
LKASEETITGPESLYLQEVLLEFIMTLFELDFLDIVIKKTKKKFTPAQLVALQNKTNSD